MLTLPMDAYLRSFNEWGLVLKFKRTLNEVLFHTYLVTVHKNHKTKGPRVLNRQKNASNAVLFI